VKQLTESVKIIKNLKTTVKKYSGAGSPEITTFNPKNIHRHFL
jgi:hypothetical protein